MAEVKKRQANFELLRIIAMMMVIVLHYIVKGHVSQKLSVDSSFTNHLWWLIQGFCNVAVNVYVLISGYFLVESKWKVSKLITLICQVLFYSILAGILMFVVGKIASVASGLGALYEQAGMSTSFGLSYWLSVILPIEYEHYWFATAYIVMYILSPVLAIAVKQLSQKELGAIIIALLCFFSIPKSINPYLIPTDSYGYDFGWFICLFLIAGYIRQYGIKLLNNKGRAILVYVGSVLVTFVVCAITGALCRATGKLEYYMDMTYTYNYIFVLISSVALFCAWTFVSLPEGKFADVVCKVASYTFGVYLFHENVGLRLVWPYLLGVHKVNSFGMQILHMILCVVVIFVLGCVVDALRKFVFGLITRCIK